MHAQKSRRERDGQGGRSSWCLDLLLSCVQSPHMQELFCATSLNVPTTYMYRSITMCITGRTDADFV